MRLVILGLFLVTRILSFGQVFEPAGYPKGVFRNPLNIPMNLSGNFGELRPNHYHMGLDLKTLKRENLPVYAAAAGYISRIKIEPGGFGRAIYINHPNGYTTVYCHLNDFFPALEAYVKRQQYQQESWNLFLDIPPELFPVRQSDMLAYSGTTGGSQAPHLHFEIRKTMGDINCNPLLFGPPLADNSRPSITRLALYDRRLSLYEQSPKFIPIRRTPDGYESVAPVVVVHSSTISFGISATDTHAGSSSPKGIFEAILFDNDQAVVGFQMDKINYIQTRNLNAHIDYKTRAGGGPLIQLLLELPGYSPSIYRQVKGDGSLSLGDGALHRIRIEVKDAYLNTTMFRTKVQYIPTGYTSPLPATGKLFYPLVADSFRAEECEFYLGEKCLYDAVHIGYHRTAAAQMQVVSSVHSIGASYIPLGDSIVVRIKPLITLDAAKYERVVMQRMSGTKREVQKVRWQNGWAIARFREMGDFQLIVDEEAPVIVPVGFSTGVQLSKASRIVFTIKDNLEEFSNFRAELDGKWLRFTNDKGRFFIYKFDEKCPPGEHELTIRVQDEAGNVTKNVFRFVR